MKSYLNIVGVFGLFCLLATPQGICDDSTDPMAQNTQNSSIMNSSVNPIQTSNILLGNVLSNSALTNAGIYRNQGNLFVDRSVTISQFLSVSSMTVSTATITNLTVSPGINSTDAAQFSQINLFQTVFSSTTVFYSTTSLSFQDTNLKGTITPSSTAHRIFIFAIGNLDVGTQGNSASATLARNGTNIMASAGQCGPFTTTGGDTVFPCSLMFIDSPSSTSNTTYSVQIKSATGAGVTFDAGNTGSGTQTMILMEIR